MRLQRNVGGADRLVRGALGVGALAAGVAAVAANYRRTGVLILVVATGLLFNAAFQFCGLNALLGVNTCRVDPGESE